MRLPPITLGLVFAALWYAFYSVLPFAMAGFALGWVLGKLA